MDKKLFEYKKWKVCGYTAFEQDIKYFQNRIGHLKHKYEATEYIYYEYYSFECKKKEFYTAIKIKQPYVKFDTIPV